MFDKYGNLLHFKILFAIALQGFSARYTNSINSTPPPSKYYFINKTLITFFIPLIKHAHWDYCVPVCVFYISHLFYSIFMEEFYENTLWCKEDFPYRSGNRFDGFCSWL